MTTNKNLARIAGLLYLIVITTGLFAEVFVRQALTVSGDAVATAHNIQTSEMLYRLGFVADLINIICGIPMDLIFFILFMSVNRNLNILAILFAIPMNAIIAVNLLNQFTPLLLLENAHHLSSFSSNQLATLSLNSLNLQSEGYAIGLVFFGFYCLIIGYLIFKSNFLPRILGVLYAVTGSSYLLNSFILFLFPKIAATIFPYFAVSAFIGEISLCLWLLIMGVNDNKISNG